MAELKPCPFCGRKIEYYETVHERGVIDELTVECDCGARIIMSPLWMGDGEVDAITAWNRRADNGC